MKIISGLLGGRQFDSPKGNRTHPMSDKARGGLFSILGDISELRVLDCFAGSGALSLEAISRGASKATAIEIDPLAQKTIKSNAEKLGIASNVKAIRAGVSSWSDNNAESTFDLVFVAPPYDNLQLPVVQKTPRHVKTGGLLVLDWPGKQQPPDIDKLKLIKQKNYGDAQLVFYRKTG